MTGDREEKHDQHAAGAGGEGEGGWEPIPEPPPGEVTGVFVREQRSTRRKTVVGGIVVAVIVAVILVGIALTGDTDRCGRDEDCVLVESQCCACNPDGAVLRARYEEHETALKQQCGNKQCPDCPTEGEFSYRAACQDAHCVMVKE